MATARTASIRPTPPKQRPLPIQNFQLSKEHFTTDSGVKQVNVLMQQIITSLQAVQGAGGPSVLPSGVDVQGSTVSNLGAPKGESDAISSGHAQSQFSAETLGPQLDIGGSNALKGLTGLQLTSNSQGSSIAAIMAKLAAGATGTITLVKLTGGGANGSITVTGGIITAFVNPT